MGVENRRDFRRIVITRDYIAGSPRLTQDLFGAAQPLLQTMACKSYEDFHFRFGRDPAFGLFRAQMPGGRHDVAALNLRTLKKPLLLIFRRPILRFRRHKTFARQVSSQDDNVSVVEAGRAEKLSESQRGPRENRSRKTALV